MIVKPQSLKLWLGHKAEPIWSQRFIVKLRLTLPQTTEQEVKGKDKEIAS